MKILVTGATGFIGHRLLLKLRDLEHEVVVLTRDPKNAVTRLPIRCKIYGWDPALLEPPREALEGVEAVIHLAGKNIFGRWTESRKNELYRSRILSTHNWIRVFKELEQKPEIFISPSGIGVYGDRGDEELDEGSSLGDDYLAHLCHQWEKEALAAQDLGIRTVVFRIGVALGSEGGALNLMLPAFRLGLGGKCGDGKQWFSWIHVDDLVDMMIFALENKQIQGPINAVSANCVTNAEFSKFLGHSLNRPTWFTAPKFLLKMVLGEMADVILGGQKVKPKKALDSGFVFKYPNLDKALETESDKKTHNLYMEQWVPQPIEKAFEFFSNAKNLETLTPRFLNFKVLSQSSEELKEGVRINYQLKLYGIPFRWQTLITEWHTNQQFSDVQVIGPYWLWHHTHEFIAKDEGTLIRDRVTYRVPLWVFGDVFILPIIKKDLHKIFSYRHKIVEEIFISKKEEAG